MRHVAMYVRVSSRRQDHRSQIPDLERWAEAYGNGEAIRWYRDKATGKNMDRPGWKRLDADLQAGRVSKLICWRIDRLGRSASQLTTLFEQFTARKIGFVSLRDGLDLSTPAGRLIANVIASVAAYENEVRTERILAGQAAAKANGKKWGGSKKGRRVSISSEQVETVRRLADEGKPKAAIARAVGISRPSVYSILAEVD